MWLANSRVMGQTSVGFEGCEFGLLAEHLERPRGWIVKQALKDWVEEEQKHLWA